jgi:hypothetical protein
VAPSSVRSAVALPRNPGERGRAMTACKRPPNRRHAETSKLTGLRYVCPVGHFADGRIGELFLSNHKSNSAADTNARDAAIVFSFAVQRGADLEKILLSRDSTGRPTGPFGAALDRICED